MQFFIVGIGGIMGSIARYSLGKYVSEKTRSTFPYGTFIINMTGAFLLGIVSALSMGSNYYILLGDGFLGAYTTFSTFMYEGFNLFQENEKLNAFVYVLLSLILGIIGYILGNMLVKSIR